MSTDAQLPPQPQTVPGWRSRLLAPWWHTAILVAVLLLVSMNGSRGKHALAAGGSKLPQYMATIVWEWMLLGFVWLGIRRRVRLRDLIGGRWAKLEDLFLDVVYAAAFWLCSIVVLGLLAKGMHLYEGGKFESLRKQLDFLVPGTRLELAVFFCVSATAGFCEEIIFRGYLQWQFAAFSNSMLIGVLLSALMFGASHGYEGLPRMVLLAVFGMMFGLLAWWRKSLRPGMIAHAWHDALSGAILRILK